MDLVERTSIKHDANGMKPEGDTRAEGQATVSFMHSGQDGQAGQDER